MVSRLLGLLPPVQEEISEKMYVSGLLRLYNLAFWDLMLRFARRGRAGNE